MKYFTKEWCSGELNEEDIISFSKSYWKYIDTIYSELPFPLKLLAKHINLHDGIVEKIILFSEHLTLEGSFGDLQTGYFYLKLEYLHLVSTNLHSNLSLKNTKLEILRNELERISPQEQENILRKKTVTSEASRVLFSHKILFSSGDEIEILFKNLQLSLASIIKKDHSAICQLL